MVKPSTRLPSGPLPKATNPTDPTFEGTNTDLRAVPVNASPPILSNAVSVKTTFSSFLQLKNRATGIVLIPFPSTTVVSESLRQNDDDVRVSTESGITSSFIPDWLIPYVPTDLSESGNLIACTCPHLLKAYCPNAVQPSLTVTALSQDKGHLTKVLPSFE